MKTFHLIAPSRGNRFGRALVQDPLRESHIVSALRNETGEIQKSLPPTFDLEKNESQSFTLEFPRKEDRSSLFDRTLEWKHPSNVLTLHITIR